MHTRTCSFCDFSGYCGDFPDGSIVSNGMAACAGCLKNPQVEKIIELAAFARFLEKEIDEFSEMGKMHEVAGGESGR